MIEVGRLIIKIAGRDAGLKGVIVEVLEKGYVLIDGQVRRRKCNVLHIEPLDKVIKIPKKATHDEVVKALKAEDIEVKERKGREKGEREKPKKQRKKKEKAIIEEKEKKPKKEVKEKIRNK